MVKCKIIWIQEYADDGFRQHIAVQSGDWDEVTEEDYELLRVYCLQIKKSIYHDEYPTIVRLDDENVYQRVLEVKEFLEQQKKRNEKEKLEREERKKKREEKKRKQQETNELKLLKELEKKYGKKE